MPTEIGSPSAPLIEQVETPQAVPSGINSPDATSLGLTPLAIVAILALILHVASGVMLDRSHASPAGEALDEAVTCPAETSQPQPALPYD
jgi:hypothetical protein